MNRPSRSSGAGSEQSRLHMTFDDNALLALLFGEHDRNLARIEQRLGVRLASRGNEVDISGPPWSTRAAKNVLDALYGTLNRGLDVDGGEVDAALRLALQGETDANAVDVASDELVVRTQKRRVEPRSRTQATYLRALNDYELVFGLGPAGTGKTYLAVAVAVSMLTAGRVDRIILSRPAVEPVRCD